MKRYLCSLCIIAVSLSLIACGSSSLDSKIESAPTNETSSFHPSVPKYAQDLLPQLLTPVDSVYESMNWNVDQFEPCQVTHLQFTGDPIEFYDQEMILYLTPTLLPSEEQRIQESSFYDFSDLPIPKDETQYFLQRFAYTSHFLGENALSAACEFMSVLDSNFRALYGSPDENAQHAYTCYDPVEFFKKTETDTISPDQHYLSDIWDITPSDIHGIQYSLIVSLVQYMDDQNVPEYRVAISYEWKLAVNNP